MIRRMAGSAGARRPPWPDPGCHAATPVPSVGGVTMPSSTKVYRPSSTRRATFTSSESVLSPEGGEQRLRPQPRAVAASLLLIRSNRVVPRVEVEGSAPTRSAADRFLRALLAAVVPSGTLDCCNGGCALADGWVRVFEAKLAGGADVHDL